MCARVYVSGGKGPAKDERECKMATKMTKTMNDAYEFLLGCVESAESKSFGEWYSGSDDDYEEWLIQRVSQLGERRVRQMLKDSKRRYALAKEGIVGSCDVTLNTLKALESRGLVELPDVYGLNGYAVKVILF